MSDQNPLVGRRPQELRPGVYGECFMCGRSFRTRASYEWHRDLTLPFNKRCKPPEVKREEPQARPMNNVLNLITDHTRKNRGEGFYNV